MTAFTKISTTRLRSGWGVKWGSLPADTIGAWVADMDFGIPGPVRARIIECTSREDFGYPFWRGDDPVITAFENRMSTHHGWQPTPGRTRVFTDLIQVLQVVIEHTTQPGDGVAMHVPSYPPFLASIKRSGRRIVPIPADNPAEGLRGCKLMLLVNPHNPTGRVFRRDELHTLAAVAEELDLVVLSDEIHADLVYPGNEHIPFATLSEDTAHRTITTTSATKAFNIAAMRCAVAHIGPARVKASLDAAPLDYFGTPSILSRVATLAAWNESSEWLADLQATLTANRTMITEWMPTESRYHAPEGTYLAWFALPGVNATRLLHEAKVMVSDGAEFSADTSVDTSAFVRLNFATSPDTLTEILTRISRTVT